MSRVSGYGAHLVSGVGSDCDTTGPSMIETSEPPPLCIAMMEEGPLQVLKCTFDMLKIKNICSTFRLFERKKNRCSTFFVFFSLCTLRAFKLSVSSRG